MRALNAVRAAILTGFQTSDTIVQGPFTFTFNQPVTSMLTEDGLHLVIAPPGTTITGYTPAPGPVAFGEETRQAGGAMLNPQMRSGSAHKQAFDARANAYDATLMPSFPLPVATGDVFMASTPAPTIDTKGESLRRGVVETYGALFFVSSFPSGTGIFAPCVGGWPGRSSLTTYQVDLDAYIATLPSLSLSGVDYPPVASIISALDRFHGGGYLTPRTTGGYEHMFPRNSAGTYTNYGRHLALFFGAAGLHLVGNVATPAQKRIILRRFVQMAINFYDAAVGSGIKPFTDGGHHQFQLVPLAVGLHAMGRSSELDTLHVTLPELHQFGQVFSVTAAMLPDMAMHTSNALPFFSRRREVRWVDPNDSRRFVVKWNSDPHDPAKLTFTNGMIYRDGNGGGSAQAAQTEIFSSLSDMTDLGIPAHRTDLLSSKNGGSESGGIFIRLHTPLDPPLQEGHFVYGGTVPGHVIAEGDVYWRVRHHYSMFTPLPNQPYWSLANFADDVLVLRAIPGLWRTAWEPLRALVVRSQPGDWPTPAYPAPTMHAGISVSGGIYNFSQTFWNAHAAPLGLT
jgi:hypothetical protein